MKNTVSLSDVVFDYINRYGLTAKARQLFIECHGQENVAARDQSREKEAPSPSEHFASD